MPHYKLLIRGKVQGVWYRASAREKARQLGLNGFVRNEADGSVYAEIEAQDENLLREMISWCQQGPPMAIVEEVIITDGEWVGFQGFEVRR